MAVDVRLIRCLIYWVNSLDIDHQVTQLKELSTGEHFAAILKRVMKDADEMLADCEDSSEGRLTTVVAAVQGYFNECDLSTVVDIDAICRQNEEHISKLLILLLMWAVQSDNNQYFVDLIRLADFEIQHYFKQILEAAMQQEQDGTMQSGEFNLPTIAASDVETGPSDASPLTPVKQIPVARFQTPYTERLQTPLMSPALKEWLVSPAATGTYKRTETSEGRLHRQLAAVQFELTRQRYVNDELECEVKDSKKQVERAESATRSLQQQMSQMRDRLDELQHIESLCHKYELEVQKYQHQVEHLSDTERQSKELQQQVETLQNELTAVQGQADEADGLFNKVSEYKAKLVGTEMKVERLEKSIASKDEEINKLFAQVKELRESEFKISQGSHEKDSIIADLIVELQSLRDSMSTMSDASSSLGVSDMVKLTRLESENKMLRDRLGELDELNELREKLEEEKSRGKLYKENAEMLTATVEKLERELKNEKTNSSVASHNMDGMAKDLERVTQEKKDVIREKQMMQKESEEETGRLNHQIEALKCVEEETRKEGMKLRDEKEKEGRELRVRLQVAEEQLEKEKSVVEKWKVLVTEGEARLRELEDTLREATTTSEETISKLTSQLNDDQDRLTKANEEINRLKQKITGSSERITELEGVERKNGELKERARQMESLLANLQEQMSEKVENEASSQAMILDLQWKIERQNEAIREERESLNKQVSGIKEEKLKLESQVESLQLTVQQLRTQMIEKETETKQLVGEKEQHSIETEEAMTDLQSQLSQLQSVGECLNAELEVKTKIISELNLSLDGMRGDIERQKKEITTLYSQLDDATQMKDSLTTQMAASRNEIGQLQSQIHTVDVLHQNELETRTKTESKLQFLVSQLEKDISRLTGELKQFQDRLTRKNVKMEEQTRLQTVELQQVKMKQEEEHAELMKVNNEWQQQLEEQEKKSKALESNVAEWRRELLVKAAEVRKNLEKDLKLERERSMALENELEEREKSFHMQFDELKKQDVEQHDLKKSLDKEKRRNLQLAEEIRSLEAQVSFASQKLRQLEQGEEKPVQNVRERKWSSSSRSPILRLDRVSIDTSVRGSMAAVVPSKSNTTIQPEYKELHDEFDEMAEQESSLDALERYVTDVPSISSRCSLQSDKGRQKQRRVKGTLPHLTEEDVENEDRLTLDARVIELQRRNAATLPHLKSSYPIELQTRPAHDMSDETIRTAKTIHDTTVSETLDPLEMTFCGAEMGSQSTRMSARLSTRPSQYRAVQRASTPPAYDLTDIRRDTFTVEEMNKRKTRPRESQAYKIIPIASTDPIEEEPATKRQKVALPKRLQQRVDSYKAQNTERQTTKAIQQTVSKKTRPGNTKTASKKAHPKKQ